MSKKEEDLLNQLVMEYENPLDVDYDEKDAIAIFEQIGKIQGATELFRSMMGRDIKLYFQAQSDLDRAQIRGGYARLAYIRGIIKNSNNLKQLLNSKKKREA